MPRITHRLNALKVKKTNEPGWYPDGDGLYLQVSPSGSKSWVYRYATAGRERRHGLGSCTSVSLTEAREAARRCRQLRKEHVDPIDHHKEQQAAKRAQRVQSITFEDCAERYIQAQKPAWRNSKHESQWRNTLRTYAYPSVGSLPVRDIETGHVLRCLEPIWQEKTETATRVRQRIEAVLDWAKAHSYRTGENPARWRGHLDKLLPSPRKVRRVEHLKALPYAEVPVFFAWLLKKETLAAKALATCILTATRSGEVRRAVVDEIDFDSKTWTIPAERMKAYRSHRVPLSTAAVKVLREAASSRVDERLFPGQQPGRPISEAALLKLVKEYDPTLTVHGFRSSFRDWCAETTNFPREVAETALAHIVSDRTEAAYQRGDMFVKREKLMQAWARFCTSPTKGDVVPLERARDAQA